MILTILLLWFCYVNSIVPLWLAIVGTVFESIKIIAQVVEITAKCFTEFK